MRRDLLRRQGLANHREAQARIAAADHVEQRTVAAVPQKKIFRRLEAAHGGIEEHPFLAVVDLEKLRERLASARVAELESQHFPRRPAGIAEQAHEQFGVVAAAGAKERGILAPRTQARGDFPRQASRVAGRFAGPLDQVRCGGHLGVAAEHGLRLGDRQFFPRRPVAARQEARREVQGLRATGLPARPFGAAPGPLGYDGEAVAG